MQHPHLVPTRRRVTVDPTVAALLRHPAVAVPVVLAVLVVVIELAKASA